MIGFTSQLNRKLELWQRLKSDERDELGQNKICDRFVRYVWAAVIPQTGTLLSGRPADTELSQTTHKIKCRYIREIKSDMWFVYDGEQYDILYILDPYLKHEILEIFCRRCC